MAQALVVRGVIIYNLENNIFQVLGVGRFTPSHHHFPLDIWKPRGNFHMKKPQGMLFGKFELTHRETYVDVA